MRKKRRLSTEHKQKLSEVNKGKHLSEEAKQKLSKIQKGKKFSEMTKKKMSESHKGKLFTKKHKRNLSKSHKGRIPGMKNKHHSDKSKQKIREARILYMSDGKQKLKNTSIELIIEQELINRHIPYLKQSPIKGIALVDFLLPNKIIVQADGDYWHSREKNKGKDIAQDIVLGFKGYKVYRFTETEINKSARKCINKVIKKEKVYERIN